MGMAEARVVSRAALSAAGSLFVAGCAFTQHDEHPGHGGAHAAADDRVMARQRDELERNTRGKGFGPQSPRDIDSVAGANAVGFNLAPPATRMNLCNIHFHRHAEHRGGEFTRYAGDGDGHGHGTGYQYAGTLTEAESKGVGRKVCPGSHGDLQPGDTIEVHYVYSTAAVRPGPTLGACLSEAVRNPQLRVEAQVCVLVNDRSARDFGHLARFGDVNGYVQALNIPADTGSPVQYTGSTTGPAYNRAGSPFQVSWSVRPKVAKVNIETLATWCEGNVFKEDHAHGVRTLVDVPALLSAIER